MPFASVTKLLDGFSRQGRDLMRRYAAFAMPDRSAKAVESPFEQLRQLAGALLSGRGEASGVALATDLLALFESAPAVDRLAFYDMLARDFGPDRAALQLAWTRYQADGDSALPGLVSAVEAPRQELFRRINLAPGGTAALVRMRADLLGRMKSAAGALAAVDADLVHLLQSWFNRGFLTMAQIDWSSPASLLERVIRYEAVHDIRDWADLRGRLAPADRRCFAFFHPAMPGEPLIFVEVALTRDVADSIQAILRADRPVLDAEAAETAIFYSISNCQPGLRGISFGHFLIKQVATDLKRALPNLKRFATLSPIPGFRAWLRRLAAETDARLDAGDWWTGEGEAALRTALMAQAADYS